MTTMRIEVWKRKLSAKMAVWKAPVKAPGEAREAGPQGEREELAW